MAYNINISWDSLSLENELLPFAFTMETLPIEDCCRARAVAFGPKSSCSRKCSEQESGKKSAFGACIPRGNVESLDMDKTCHCG